MSSLSKHIKSEPKKNMSQWASDFGISRPYLYALLDGSRSPSLPVAIRISEATQGEVRICDWPNLAAVGAAVNQERAAS